MILKKNINNEYIAYTYINGVLRSVGVFWTQNEARDYCIREYKDFKIEAVIENTEPMTSEEVQAILREMGG